MYKWMWALLFTLSIILTACAQNEEKASDPLPTSGQPTNPGKPIEPGTPIIPGKPITPGTPITPGKPITPGIPITPGKPIEIHLTNSNIHVTKEKEQIKLQLPDTLLFDYDKSELKAGAKEVLDEISGELKKIQNAGVQINGYTDNQGDEKYNLHLSDRRAKEVEKYFKNKGYLQQITFTTKGFGEAGPAAPNDTAENRQKNRRVEIIIKSLH